MEEAVRYPLKVPHRVASKEKTPVAELTVLVAGVLLAMIGFSSRRVVARHAALIVAAALLAAFITESFDSG